MHVSAWAFGLNVLTEYGNELILMETNDYPIGLSKQKYLCATNAINCGLLNYVWHQMEVCHKIADGKYDQASSLVVQAFPRGALEYKTRAFSNLTII